MTKRKKFIFAVQMEITDLSQEAAYEKLMKHILTAPDIDLFGSELVEVREI